MSSADPTTTATPDTTTAPTTAATPATATPAVVAPDTSVAKKSKATHAVMNFGQMAIAQLILFALAILKGLTNNPTFTNPPVTMAVFSNHVTTLQDYVAAATINGGKVDIAQRDQQAKLVIQDLKQLAIYVENNCNDDPALFARSGFIAKTGSRSTAGQPVAIPVIKSLGHGPLSGQVMLRLKAVRSGRSYKVRYSTVIGGLPGN
jgi:hypothetical protein